MLTVIWQQTAREDFAHLLSHTGVQHSAVPHVPVGGWIGRG
ncbi:hypothetical protein VRRI112168_16505 [Vreelandella rituensis]